MKYMYLKTYLSAFYKKNINNGIIVKCFSFDNIKKQCIYFTFISVPIIQIKDMLILVILLNNLFI